MLVVKQYRSADRTNETITAIEQQQYLWLGAVSRPTQIAPDLANAARILRFEAENQVFRQWSDGQ